ncbi:hypothetical protein KY315_04195, partial [Candidatus Woesearchaeota archaeon]|nr:hypothetical protein [Candidatus Woesearchaeota archaeon]
ELESVQKALGKETVGYEIVEQGKNYCIVKNVSGNLEDFDPILRRIFLLLISMAEEGQKAMQTKDTDMLRTLIPMEESNNRFTTTCRRYLNKKGHESAAAVGPLYYILEDLENIADQYKYLYKYLTKKDLKKMKISDATLKYFEKTTTLLKTYYDLFYKPDKEKIAEIGRMRKSLIKEWYSMLGKMKDPVDIVICQNMLTIIQKVFNLTGPYLAFNTDIKIK